ncbi:hypothetical protein BCR44DRAFT_54399 [Catenaria anguillulae PL171]|uniref:Uncharacterized protein n=1 Tax=Catenaria anguillulae PL171 TaxID=765915 RepID=A0A1Y2HB30_9FUNG|nr:hypothetical protein BCR44DRAFT_54399 [Catenaria anguillulae PL171]
MSLWSRTTILVILVTSLPLSGYLFLVSCIHLYKSGSRYIASNAGTSTPTSSLAGGSSSTDALIPMVVAAAQVLGSIGNLINQSLFLVQAVVPASRLPIGGCVTWIWVADIAYLTFQPCATLVIIHRATAVISPKATVWFKRRATAQIAFSVVFLTGFLLVALSVFLRRIWTDTNSDTCGAEYVLSLNSAGKMIFFALYMALALTFALPLLSHLRQTSVIRESKAKLPSRSVSGSAKVPSPLHVQSADKPGGDKIMSTDHRGDGDEYNRGATSSNNGRRSANMVGTYQVTSLPGDWPPNRGPAALPFVLPPGSGDVGGGGPGTPSPTPNACTTPNRPTPKLRPATHSPSAHTLKESTEDKLRRLLHDVTFRIMIAVLAYLATATAALFGGFSNAFSVQFTFENLAALYAATLSSGNRSRKRPSSNLSLASLAATPRALILPVPAKLMRSVSATSNRAVVVLVGAVGKKLLGKVPSTVVLVVEW